MLLNLIMNGVDAMSAVPDRLKMLTITSQSIEPMGMRVTVEDTGTGLDSATADRIFDPCFTTKPKGMGMGLRICQSIVGAHGGRLSASQRRPHGAIFEFTVERAVDSSQSVELMCSDDGVAFIPERLHLGHEAAVDQTSA